MNTMGRRYEVTEWRRGFAQLLEGKPFDIRRDQGFAPGDVLIVREYDDVARVQTDMVAIFRITWVARPGDNLCEGLISEGAVVLGLAPANVVTAVPPARPPENTAPCSRCGIRTAHTLLRRSTDRAAGGEGACPFCAPLVRHATASRGSRSTLLLAAARLEAARLREVAGKQGLDGDDLAEVVPVLLSELVGGGQGTGGRALRALTGGRTP